MASLSNSGRSSSNKSAAARGTVSGDELSTSVSHHVDRASATSPSAVSTSEDEGGARLDARLDQLSLDPEASPAGTTYAPPHTRQGHGTPNFALNLRGASATRGSPGFQVAPPDDEDVFLSPGKPAGAFLSPGHGGRGSIPDRQLAASGAEGMTSPQGLVRTDEFGESLRPLRSQRSSDLGARHQVGGVDAQAFYPASACVFVANLPEGVKDSKLEAEVTRHFSKFGVVFVKIRRDQKNMPFAFCQYTNDQDAREGMIHGKGTVIHGRACRTEMVKANRTYILYNCNDGDVGVEEARDLLEPYGPLAKCHALDSKTQEALNMGQSVLIEFVNFDPSRDIQAAFRHHPSYRVMAHDPKKASQGPRVDADEAWLQRYEVERRSIFIGNLPTDVEDLEDKIRAVVEDIGDVANVQVIHKEGKNGRPAVFSFVEFVRPDMADCAVKRLSGCMLFGCEVRVERKASRNVGGQQPRRVRSNMVLGEAYRTPARDQQYSAGYQSLQRETYRGPSREQQYSASHQNFHPGDMNTVSENTAQSSDGAGPSTPLRPQGAGSGANGNAAQVASSAAPPMPGYWMPSPYGQNYTSPNYTTTPYGAQVPASPYTAATPQGTPQGYGSPYGYYPAAYSWATPYMQDPNFAAAAYNHTYGQVPIPAAQAGDVPDTPTKTAGAGSGEMKGSQGGDDA